MTPLARLSATRSGDVVVLTIGGEIDRANQDELRTSMLAQVPEDCTGVVIDLSHTRYLDSAGLNLLFEVQRRLIDRGKRLALCVAEGAVVRRALSITGADALIPSADTLHQALAFTQTGNRGAPQAP